MSAFRSRTVWLAIILASAFALRLGWVIFTDWQPLPDDDAFRYDFAARALVNGEGYIHLNGAATAFWPPGYPLLLAMVYWLFGQEIIVAQLLNVALSTATVALIYLIGRRTLGTAPAIVGAAIVAGFPSLIFFTGVTLSEVAFTFLALLGIYLLVLEAQSGRRDTLLLVTAGLVLGLAALTRGQALLLPVVVIPFWLLTGIHRRGGALRLAAVVLGLGRSVAPWAVCHFAHILSVEHARDHVLPNDRLRGRTRFSGETGVTIFRAAIVEALHAGARPQTASETGTRPQAPSKR